MIDGKRKETQTKDFMVAKEVFNTFLVGSIYFRSDLHSLCSFLL